MLFPAFAEWRALLPTAKRVLVISDGRPDGDSIGSSTATYAWLKRDFPHLHLQAFCREVIPPSLFCLEHAPLFTSDPACFDEAWDLLVFHDASDLDHAGVRDLLPRLPNRPTIINIDHHNTNTRYGDINALDTTSCATTEVLYRCFRHANVPLSASMRDSLLAGLFTDTGFFSNGGTTASSLTMAADLKKHGARFWEISRSTLSKQSPDRLTLLGTALSRLTKRDDLDLATTYVLANEYEALADTEAVSGLSNILNQVCRDASNLLVLRDTSKGQIFGSLRSSKNDISRLSRLLGGGGHKKAAGFSLPGRLARTAEGQITITPSTTTTPL
jgi:phosphoesterase RecJ-like protein